MASWIIHLAIAVKVSDVFDLNNNRFYLGNLLPDSTLGRRIIKEKTHFRTEFSFDNISNSTDVKYYDYNKFLHKYQGKIFDDLHLGYFAHLFADEVWAHKIYEKYMRDEYGNKKLDQQSNYYHDYDILNEIVFKKYDLNVLEILNGMRTVHLVNEIDEIEIDDIPRIYQSLTQYSKETYEDATLVLFDEEDILEFIEYTADEIVKAIMDRGLREKK